MRQRFFFSVCYQLEDCKEKIRFIEEFRVKKTII